MPVVWWKSPLACVYVCAYPQSDRPFENREVLSLVSCASGYNGYNSADIYLSLWVCLFPFALLWSPDTAHPPGCFSCRNVPLWAVTCRKYVAGVCSNSYQVRGLLRQLFDISHLPTLAVFTFTVPWWDYQIVSRLGLARVVSRRTPLSQSRDLPLFPPGPAKPRRPSGLSVSFIHGPVGPGLHSKVMVKVRLHLTECCGRELLLTPTPRPAGPFLTTVNGRKLVAWISGSGIKVLPSMFLDNGLD